MPGADMPDDVGQLFGQRILRMRIRVRQMLIHQRNGYRRMRIKLDDQVIGVDILNLHAECGDADNEGHQADQRRIAFGCRNGK